MYPNTSSRPLQEKNGKKNACVQPKDLLFRPKIGLASRLFAG
jgi:hypothetical protein